MVPQMTRSIISVISIVFSISMAFILIKMVQYLSCNTSIQIKDKHLFLRIIRSKTSGRKDKVTKQELSVSFTRYVRYATIICSTAYLLGNLSASYALITINIIEGAVTLELSQVCALFFWYSGRILMHSVFIQRLKYSLKDTKWMYSTHVFKWLYCALSVILALFVIDMALLIVRARVFSTQLALIAFIIFDVMLLLDSIFSIIICILFQRKVYQLITSYYILFQKSIQSKYDRQETVSLQLDVDPERTDSGAQNALPSTERTTTKDESLFYNVLITGHNDGMDITDPREKYKMEDMKVYNYNKLQSIHTIVQYTLLISLSLVTSIIPMAISFIGGLTTVKDKANVSRNWFYFEVSIVIDAFINALCLYLHFPFSMTTYKCLCGASFCCHKKCLFCVGRFVENRILQDSI
eukprot:26070_1